MTRRFLAKTTSDTRAPTRGFSLIEVMTVVVILGVLTVMAVPQFAPSARRNRVTGALETVASFVARARMHALTSGRCVRVRVATQTPARLVGEELNIYDCMDSGANPATTPRIDGSAPLANNLWKTVFELTLDDKDLEITFDDDGTPLQPRRLGGATLPALNGAWFVSGDEFLVYRPTGRLWSDHDPATNQDPSLVGNGIYDDDGALLVRSVEAPAEKAYVVAESHGPICIVNMGAGLVENSPGDYVCP